MPALWALGLGIATGCTHAQATHARLAGEVMSITRVAGILGGVLVFLRDPEIARCLSAP